MNETTEEFKLRCLRTEKINREFQKGLYRNGWDREWKETPRVVQLYDEVRDSEERLKRHNTTDNKFILDCDKEILKDYESKHSLIEQMDCEIIE